MLSESTMNQIQSDPPRPIQAMQGHLRQNSIPSNVTFNLQYAAATGCFPETYGQIPDTRRQIPKHHRRGLSLDPSIRLQELRLTNTRSPLGTTGMINTNNQGQIHRQQNMRETQMPAMSRPGQLLDNIKEDPGMCENQVNLGATTLQNDTFPVNWQSSMGEMRSVGLQGGPITPANMGLNVTPLSYATVPYPQEFNLVQPTHTRHGSIDMSLQAVPTMVRGRSLQEHIALARSQSQNSAPGSMMNLATKRNTVIFAPTPVPALDLKNMQSFDFGLQGYESGYESSAYSPTLASPLVASIRATPELPSTLLFGELDQGIPQLSANDTSEPPSSPTRSTRSRASSPRKKAGLPENMAIIETGITMEQVDAFIQGPDPATNKYSCLFEGCNLPPTGRKENIRTHIQTHLNDRKYVCTICNSKFVRPNDFIRHAGTHEEKKEYMCKCGASFGRKDALKRHRERKPFCADGDPTLTPRNRPEKKRGRPRKIQGDETNERREQKKKIRKQVMADRERQGSLPQSETASKSGRSCSPEYKMEAGYDTMATPPNMAFTPPMSPDANCNMDPYPALQTSVARISLSPPPTADSLTQVTHDFAFDHESPFGEDHFATDPFTVPQTPPESSPYEEVPQLDLSCSPATSRFTIDFSDLELTQPTVGFSSEFLNDSALLDPMIGTDGSKGQSMVEFDNFVMLDEQ